MGQLTQQQMETLQAQVTAGDRAGYYSTLENAGVAYGALAGGVVREDTLSGRMANAFMAGQAAQMGVVMDRNIALNISVDLMRADFDARVNKYLGAEIGYGPIQEYHEIVFEQFHLDRNAWTATTPLDVIGDNYAFYGYSSPHEARTAAWNAMINGGLAGQKTMYFEMEKFAFPDGMFASYPDGYPVDPRAYAWYVFVNGTVAAYPDYMAEGWLPGQGAHPFNPLCFPASTPIAVFLTETRPIADIRLGDTVLSFDPAADLGRGALVPRKVVRLYRNTTEEWVKLTWAEKGEAKELIATPGHHFLDRFGNFPTIEEMLEKNRTTVILSSGETAEVTAERIIYSADTAHLFERVSGSRDKSGPAH